ncbi:hypothetical protein M1349_04730 [Patescibacteria group bacterium]|nr:hypothetical protein [Patescibacteria group bacterium]
MLRLMGNPFKRVWQVYSALNYSKRTLTIIGIIAISAIIPVTVFLSQQQQEIRQRASGTDNYYCATACIPERGATLFDCKNEGDICTGTTSQCCQNPVTTTTTTAGGTTTTTSPYSCSNLGLGYKCTPTNDCPASSRFIAEGCGTNESCCKVSELQHCSNCNNTIKFCGSKTWDQAAGTSCTDPSAARFNEKTDQVVCRCTQGEPGGCENLKPDAVAAQCGANNQTAKCSRCSDVYKYCHVEYSKTNNQCGGENLANDKVYTLACNECGIIGDDKGYCPGAGGNISTARCNTTTTTAGSFNCSGTQSGYEYQCFETCTGGWTSSAQNNMTPKPNCLNNATAKTCCYRSSTTTTTKPATTTTRTSSSTTTTQGTTNTTATQPQCKTSGSCATSTQCCSGYTCTSGTCQPITPDCQPLNGVATSKNPYKCSNNACSRVTTISCEVDACSPRDANTCSPGGNTTLTLTLGLDGLGTTGDNANPALHSGSNKNPGHKSRSIKVKLVSSTGQALPDKTGQVEYSSSSGKFTSTINLGAITSGSYTVKVNSPVYLTTIVSSMMTITSGTANNAPTARLTTGNINDEGLSNNTLDIMDYNILLGCVRDDTITNIPAAFIASCNSNANNATMSDLDDNGIVDRNDWNLWIRELGHQLGAQ